MWHNFNIFFLDFFFYNSSIEDDRMRIERMEEDKFCYTQAFKTVTEFYSHSNGKCSFNI